MFPKRRSSSWTLSHTDLRVRRSCRRLGPRNRIQAMSPPIHGRREQGVLQPELHVMLCSAALRAHAAGKAKQSKAKGGGRDTPAGQQTKICYCYLGISKSYHAPRVEQKQSCCMLRAPALCGIFCIVKAVVMSSSQQQKCAAAGAGCWTPTTRGWHVSFHPRQGVASPAATICQKSSLIHRSISYHQIPTDVPPTHVRIIKPSLIHPGVPSDGPRTHSSICSFSSTTTGAD
jgi:hypothetical protein